ncbi:PREDICTED: vesicle transport protein SEC20-like, partial [Rhagoletis zephyria]|uniref:vesicle transport protein SEC20-like n=1 Tax=Rhagoletis zephyria TaxID=28612 RepID=UPI0008115210
METMLQIKVLKESIHRNDIAIKNLLKDIWECEGTLQDLNRLNMDISKRFSQTRQDLADIKRLIKSIEDSDTVASLASQHEQMQNQFEVNMLVQSKAVTASTRRINQRTRESLFKGAGELRNRQLNGNYSDDGSGQPSEEILANQASHLTESLQSVNRLLASEVEKSKYTLDTLVSSSAVVTETSEEFKTMSSYIANSKTLLNKYGRRELTDKVLIALAIAFFYG